LIGEQLGEVARPLEHPELAPHRAQMDVGLGDAVEQRVHVGDVGVDGVHQLVAGDAWRLVARRWRIERCDVGGDRIEQPEDVVDSVSWHGGRAIAERRERVFDLVRPLGDAGLFDDARGPLESVREAQELLRDLGRRPRLELQHAAS
jgi:hypothetical protein